MIGNSFGTLFRVATFGESHGKAVGVIIDGCPPDFSLDIQAVQHELNRRRPGQSELTTQRKELDEVEFYSGLFEGKTTGAPLMAMVTNSDVRSKDYSTIKDLFRPGHADFPYFMKYTHRDYRGGGRSSARETVGRVIAGAVAKQLLATAGVKIQGGVIQVGSVEAKRYDWAQVEDNIVRSVDPEVTDEMVKAIEEARKARDSIGAVVETQALGVPAGLGEPVWGRLDALIAGALMSLPAVKGVEIGAGFRSVSMRGSEMNDAMYPEGFASNNSGGILGGISTGAPIVARLALKPTSSIPKEQNTINTKFEPATIATLGRHDPCVGIRAVPIAEAVLALVLVDSWMQDLAVQGVREYFSPRKKRDYAFCQKE